MWLNFPRLQMAMPALAAALCLAVALAAALAADEQDVTIEKPKVGHKGDRKADDKKADDKKADEKSSSNKPADEKTDEKKEEHAAGKTHTVARGPFKLEVSLEASLS